MLLMPVLVLTIQPTEVSRRETYPQYHIAAAKGRQSATFPRF